MERPISPHKIFLEEKKKIDDLYSQGYRISNVNETLNGDYVEFTKINENDEVEKEELLILNPDARIYFSTLILAELRAL